MIGGLYGLKSNGTICHARISVALSPPIEANVDPHFDKFMESGIRHVYTLFENKSVESSEQFYSFMRTTYKNDPCSSDFECIERGAEMAQSYARIMNIKLETE